jgi:2,3-bisphosphoglycerate-dependent phosphoglycerate mutase
MIGPPSARGRQTRFIVVRHGETVWNTQARIQGQTDSDLTAAGLAQAEAIGKRLARERFDAIVASDLGRAARTAERIAAHCGLAVSPEPGPRERCFGQGEGLTYPEVDARWPGVFSRAANTDPDAAIPGGETRRQFHERIHAAFLALGRAHAGQRVVAVTHGGVLAVLYRIVHGIPIAHAHKVAISNASYNAVAFDGDAWRLEAWDDTSHLGEATPFVES